MTTKIDIANKISAERRYYVGYCAHRFSLSILDSEDLVSESSYNALKHCDKLDHMQNFHKWFMTIIRNSFINDYRKSVKMPTDSLEFARVKGTDPDDESSDLLRFIRGRNIRHFDLLIEHVCGYEYGELAKEHRLPIGTVKNRIHKARKEAIRLSRH